MLYLCQTWCSPQTLANIVLSSRASIKYSYPPFCRVVLLWDNCIYRFFFGVLVFRIWGPQFRRPVRKGSPHFWVNVGAKTPRTAPSFDKSLFCWKACPLLDVHFWTIVFQILRLHSSRFMYVHDSGWMIRMIVVVWRFCNYSTVLMGEKVNYISVGRRWRCQIDTFLLPDNGNWCVKLFVCEAILPQGGIL